MKLDKLNAEIEQTRARVAKWQARLNDLEQQRIELENLEILQTVRDVAVSPENIWDVLEQIRLMGGAAQPAASVTKEEESK